MKNTYLFVYRSDHYWGRGSTLKEARSNWRKAGGSGKRLITMLVNADKDSISVNDFGDLEWKAAGGFELSDSYAVRIDNTKGIKPAGPL